MFSFHNPLPTKCFNMIITLRHLLHFIWRGVGDGSSQGSGAGSGAESRDPAIFWPKDPDPDPPLKIRVFRILTI